MGRSAFVRPPAKPPVVRRPPFEPPVHANCRTVIAIPAGGGLTADREFRKGDPVVAAPARPDVPHYTVGGIELLDYLKAKMSPAEFVGYLRGQAIKYLTRMGHKDSDVDDAEKAARYSRWLADELQSQVKERLEARYGKKDD